MDIAGQVFLVTGATGGLGGEIAARLAGRGAELVVTGRDEIRLEALEVRAERFTADLRLPSAAEEAVDRAIATHGRLDGVVNAAGVVAFGMSADTDPDVVEELYLTNTFLPIFLFDAAGRRMEDGGCLVNLTGVVAERPTAGMAAYSGSKAAISAHLSALRRELRPRRITVLDARPGHTETELSRHPIAGQAPRLGGGHDPADVASRIVDAIADDETDLGPGAFG